MGIYSTHDYLTRGQIINKIKDRFGNLDKMSNGRLVEILEALCQQRDYEDEDHSDPLQYNNFWVPTEHHDF